MTIGGERGSVQNPLIRYATDINWTYITPDDALIYRGGETGLVFKDTFITQLQKLNPFMTQSLSEELLKKIETLPSSMKATF